MTIPKTDCYEIITNELPGGSLAPSMYMEIHPIFWGEDSRCDRILLGGGGLSSEDT